MATLINRITPRNVAYTGLISGLIFVVFEVSANGYLDGASAAAMPLRMVSAIVLGPGALDPHYSLALAATTGLMLILSLSLVFAGVFATIFSQVARATKGEFLAGSGAAGLAGVVFGTVLWLGGFYFVAPLAGWSWFPADVHHDVHIVAHALFFGCPLGWLWARAGIAPHLRRHQRQSDSASNTRILRLPGAGTESTAFNVDFFSKMPTILTAITIVMFVAFCLWLIAIYIGVEYVRPAWDTHSVPAELLY